MRFIVKLLLVGVGSFFALQFFPWWSIVLIPFILNLLLKTRGAGAFGSSFLGVSLAWFVASYTLYSQNSTGFTSKMAKVFMLPVDGIIFIIISSLLMGLIAALSGYTGNAFRNILIKPDNKSKSKYGRPDYSRYSR